MVHLPDGADVWIASIGGENFSIHGIARTKYGFRYPTDGVAGALLPQSLRERFPLFGGESITSKEAGLATTFPALTSEWLNPELRRLAKS